MCNAAALVNDKIQRMEITKIANLFGFRSRSEEYMFLVAGKDFL